MYPMRRATVLHICGRQVLSPLHQPYSPEGRLICIFKLICDQAFLLSGQAKNTLCLTNGPIVMKQRVMANKAHHGVTSCRKFIAYGQMSSVLILNLSLFVVYLQLE